MKRPWLKLILAALLLPVVLYGFVGYSDIGDLAPSNTEVLVAMPKPLQVLERVIDSELLATVASQEGGKGMSRSRQFWAGVKKYGVLLEGARHFVKSLYVAVPHNPTPGFSQTQLATYYVDLGFAGRVLSDVTKFGVIRLPGQPSFTAGYRVFLQPPLAIAFVDNFLVLGHINNVMGSLETLAGQTPTLNAAGDRLSRMQHLVEDDAQAAVFVFSRALFRAPSELSGRLDPRAFFKASAVDLAVGSVHLTEDGAAASLKIVPVPGKVVSPFTPEKTGSFSTAALPDDGTVVYAAMRLDRPADLAPVVLEMLDTSGQVNKLRRKIALLGLAKLMEYAGPEIAVVTDEDLGLQKPVFVWRVSQMEPLREFLENLSRNAASETAVLNTPLGPDGSLLGDLLMQAPNDEAIGNLLLQVDPAQRKAVAELAEQLRDKKIDLATLLAESQRLSVGGSTYFWRLSEERLLLSVDRNLVDRFAKNLAAGKLPPEFADEKSGIPTDGPVLAWINLVPWLNELATGLEHPAAKIAARRPHVAIGSRSDGTDLELVARLNVDIGLAPVTPRNLPWAAVFWILKGLSLLLGLYLGWVIVRAVLTIRSR